MNFNLCLIRPEGNVHVAAFDEVIDVLEAALISLGHGVRRTVNGIHPGARNIVFGFYFLDHALAAQLPRDTVLFNTEQLIRDDSPMTRATILWCQQGLEVWDYSPAGVTYLKELGVNAHLFRLGYHSAIHRIDSAAVQDIDVLFYGSINDRRRNVIDHLKRLGMHVFLAFGAYGAPRDALIARSKVVLNMHHYDSKIFEVVRCFYLMANAKAVVSQLDADTQMDDVYKPGLLTVPYDGLAVACAELVADLPRRQMLEATALRTLQTLDQARIVGNLLALSTPEESYGHS